MDVFGGGGILRKKVNVQQSRDLGGGCCNTEIKSS